MIRFDDSLESFAERFLAARDVGAGYSDQVRARVRHFCQWSGHSIAVADVDCDLVNAWLGSLASAGLTAWTVDGYRRCLLVVWNEAYRAGLNDHPPLRLKRIRKPRLVVRAYTHCEIRSLLLAASKLVRTYSNGRFEADFWQAAIHAAYSTGLRRGDLLRLGWADVSPDGTATVLQHKTNYPVTVRLSGEALHFARRLESDLVLPYPNHINYFGTEFYRLAVAAGVGGQFRWLRRSAGSYADRERPGDGPRILGQRTEKVFRAHYDDRSITGARPVEPPGLL